MSDDTSSASHGPAMPPEALQQGAMNQVHPFFETAKEGAEPEAEKVTFGTVGEGRQKYVKPGRYPLKNRRMKDLDGKVITVKGQIRTDH